MAVRMPSLRLRLPVLAALTWLTGCSGSGEPSTGPGPFRGVQPDDCFDGTEGVHHVSCEGIELDLHVPSECIERACGLIVDVHGSTMTGEQEEAHTQLGALARERGGYVVLQPWAPGVERHWDEQATGGDALVLAAAERVMNVFSVDRRRVHFTGMSQGGFMTWRMLCLQPNLFASFAPLAGTASSFLRDTNEGCVDTAGAPLAPRPVLYGHGTADALVDFSGAVETIEAVRAAWGLTQEESLDAGDGYKLTRYSGDGAGVIEFLEHDLSSDYAGPLFGAWEGHCFPGSDGPIGCGAGPAWGETVLQFFEAHPKR